MENRAVIIANSHPLIKELTDKFHELKKEDEIKKEFFKRQINNAQAESKRRFKEVWNEIEDALIGLNYLDKRTDGKRDYLSYEDGVIYHKYTDNEPSEPGIKHFIEHLLR